MKQYETFEKENMTKSIQMENRKGAASVFRVCSI